MNEARTQPDHDAAAATRRRNVRRAGVTLAVVTIACIPLLVLARQPTGKDHPGAKPAAGSGSGSGAGSGASAHAGSGAGPGSGAARPGAGSGATSGSANAVAPEPTLPIAPIGTTEATAVRLGEGDPVPPPNFQCKPVKKDESITEAFPTPLPPFSKGMYPCTRCHDKPEDFNMAPRNLTAMHMDIKLVHGPHEQWCYGCHNPTDRNMLRLAGGRLVPFSKSYELCGQCHGEKLRDWRLGVHGRRTGCWNGQKEYLLCVNCHNQHAPKFKPLQPKPRPKTPSEIELPGGDHE